MHERSGRAAGAQKIHDHIERLRVQERRRPEIFSGCRRSRKYEDSRTNDGADAERRQRPWPQRFTEPVLRVLRLRNQFVDGLATEYLAVGSTNAPGCRLSG